MAKKKKSNGGAVVPIEAPEEMAYILTRLFHIINPTINEGRAYPIVLDMVNDGLGEDNIETYGELIRATSFDTNETH